MTESPQLTNASDLPTLWRERALELRRVADAEGPARALETAAQELQDALAQEGDTLLTVEEAAQHVGRHRDTIGNAIRSGRLTNHGIKHRPRVRAAELVIEFPPSSVASPPSKAYDRAADARATLERRRGGR